MAAGPFRMQVEQVHFSRNETENTDGHVLYLILSPCPGDPPGSPCRHVCDAHPVQVHHYEFQRFRRGGFGHRKDATPEQIARDEANVWGWAGDDPPTLSPSFLALDAKGGKVLRPYRAHLFLRAGRIDLCGDSTVTLEPNPRSCTHREGG